ncbi:hypothetical protein [Undibacterium sp. Ren11W]|uniref:hypothetical protein n=1 Tax=Undibacterium sp. Ren11W TaxID=3413045 RepID=UPI003BF05511
MPFDPTASAPAQVHWYLVPWGVADHLPKRLRFSARMMLRQEDWTNVDAFADWPRYLAAMGSAQIGVSGQRDPEEVDLALHYQRNLTSQGITLDQASRLWQALFGDLAARFRQGRSLGVEDTLLNRANQNLEKAHCSASLASVTGRCVAGIFADGLMRYSGAARAAGLAAADDAVSGRVPHVPPSEASLRNLHGAAALYTSVKVQGRGLAEQIDAAANQISAFNNLHAFAAQVTVDSWSVQALTVLSAASGTKAAGDDSEEGHEPARVPYSSTHVDFLLTKNTRAPGADSHKAVAGDEHGMDAFAVHLASRKLVYANAGEPSSRPSLGICQEESGNAALIQEFCRRAAAMSVHPWLAKLLGISISVEHEFAVPPTAMSAIAVTGVRRTPGAPAEPVGDPQWTLLKDGFPVSIHAAQAYQQGVLNLGGHDEFVLAQLDVDRTPDRFVQSAISYSTEQQAGRLASQIGIQPQETVGVSLIEIGEKRKLAAVKTQEQPESASAPATRTELYLEHLLAGYRPDIRNVSASAASGWQSLTARRIRRVQFGKDGEDVTHWFSQIGRCEAFLTEMTRTAKDESGSVKGQLEGEMFRWGTLGLGAGNTATPVQELQMCSADSASAVGELIIEYDAADAPHQRFGQQYRCGVRLAMIDGNSLELARAERLYNQATPPLTIGDGARGQVFHRFEPIAPPNVLLIDPLDRAHFAKDASRRVIVATSVHHRRERGEALRVLVPPRASSQDLCLRHGVFDAFRNHGTWPGSAFKGVKLTKEGDFPSRKTTFKNAKGAQLHPLEQFFERHALAGRPDTPYYPDPWATRAVVAIYRKGDERLMYCDSFNYYQGNRSWPDCAEMRLKVLAQADGIDPDVGFAATMDAHGLTVRLLKGAQVILRVWHEVTRPMLEQAGVVEQIAQLAHHVVEGAAVRQAFAISDAEAADITTVRAKVVDLLERWESDGLAKGGMSLKSSSFWMINPYEELDLVHAVDQAMRPIEPDDAHFPLTLERFTNKTSACVLGHVLLERSSTNHLRGVAHWIDLPTRAAADRAGGYAFTAALRNVQLFDVPNIAMVAGDDHGSPALAPMPRQLPPFQRYQRLDAQLSVRDADHSKTTAVTGDVDFGDTRARAINVITSGEARHADEFTGFDGEKIRRSSKSRRVVVACTERPEQPTVDYVVPVFAWDDRTAPFNTSKRSRQAGWFRVWLGPIWYKSGNGELLALVCWPGAALPTKPSALQAILGINGADNATPHPAVEPVITRWGLDPILGEDMEFGNIPASALMNRLCTQADLERTGGPHDVLDIDMYHLQDVPLEPCIDLALLKEYENIDFGPIGAGGTSASTIKLALYRPILDRGSGKMFVDIQIDPALAYQPFVRLALARYQAHARHDDLEDLRLSPIVATEFIQLMPERTATLTSERDARGHVVRVRVTITGTTIPDSKAAALKTALLATIEERQVGLVLDEPAEPINGAWVPVSNKADEQLLTHDAATNSWSVTLPFQSRVSREYSVRIEEYEQLSDEVQGKRLVYFDRMVLHYF